MPQHSQRGSIFSVLCIRPGYMARESSVSCQFVIRSQLVILQGDGTEQLRQENQQLTDMVVRQRELIQQLRGQGTGTPTPPEQVA